MDSAIMRPAQPKVVLVPWDPNSRDHVERMIRQRIACGWNARSVPEWAKRQREGRKNLQWIVLNDSEPSREKDLAQHTTTYPDENTALVDSATSLSGKSRQPDSTRTFIPIGHISLDTDYETPGYEDPSPGLYYIAAFFISEPLQSLGIGRAAMDIVETTAISQPLCAKRLVLSTQPKDDETRVARFKALKKDLPKVTNQEWYSRRGYVVYRTVENMWADQDDTGKLWRIPGVFMKKDIAVD